MSALKNKLGKDIGLALAPVVKNIIDYIGKKGIMSAVRKYGRETVDDAREKAREFRKSADSQMLTKPKKKEKPRKKIDTDTYKKEDKKRLKKEQEKLDPVLKNPNVEKKTFTERYRDINELLKKAKASNNKKSIEALTKRKENLRALQREGYNVLQTGRGEKFSRGGLVKTGHTDLRSKGLFK
jgi:hypothetical protein|tara:strand:+ start:51 stop:599 length:549 start_codon:yes stop_codon:yes gene_type:complete